MRLFSTAAPLVVASVAFGTLGCSDDATDPSDSGVADVQDTATNTDTTDDVSPDSSDAAHTDTVDDVASDGDPVEVDATDTSEADGTADVEPTADPLVDCEDLDYATTCDDPNVRTGGYYACSDYFGDTTGVEVQCSANPGVEVRSGGPPCGEYEHFVGSCVYYSEALPDRCYVTHVGAESADLVEAGQAFWRTACTGEWIE